MPVTGNVSTAPYFSYDGVDYSSQLESVTMSFSIEQMEATVSGDTTRGSMPGLENWTMSATIYNDATEEAHLWVNKGLAKVFVLKRSTAAVGASNPTYTGTGYVASWNPIEATVGDREMITIEVVAAGAMVRATS
tara:strand:+ start:56 stop:460 length:405 start_codon:yes stop_codon:yes gene_type:complete